ncbi:MAG: hypothetical protein M1503_13020 [Thaumarchaeota archaeon]|nr:hypothetical protein [Nitrososphaerota archaeon]MCL5319160.1 hypothetical protein [Nitrososphaerota archaeon]
MTPKSNECFIATAAYGTPYSKEIDILRDFRDNVLMKSTYGQRFTEAYYNISPPIAKKVEANYGLKISVRVCLSIIIWFLKQLR